MSGGFVQAVVKNTGGSGGGAVVANADGLIATGNGSTIIVFAGAAAGNAAVANCTDSANTTYKLWVQDTNNTSPNISPCLLWVGKPNASINSVSVTSTGKTSIIVIEDNSSNGNVDLAIINRNQAATAAPTTGNGTPNVAPESAYAFLYFGGATVGSSIIVPSGWIALSGPGFSANGANDDVAAGSTVQGMRKAVSTTASFNAQPTMASGTPTGFDSVLVTLYNNAGGIPTLFKIYSNGSIQANVFSQNVVLPPGVKYRLGANNVLQANGTIVTGNSKIKFQSNGQLICNNTIVV